MTTLKEDVESLFRKFSKEPIQKIEQLPQSGSDRMYFRVYTEKGNYIAAQNSHVKENRTFLNFSQCFQKIGAPVPKILAVNESETMYLQQDFGNISLLDELEEKGKSETVLDLYKKSLKALASLQIKADKELNYDWCITSREFGRQAILNDLLYFKYYFLDTLKIPYDKETLLNDFDALSHYLSHVQQKHFMYRDFQGRNILIENGEVHFIDYQGGMKGALHYDVASLLWQAKANLDEDWKNELLEYYMDRADELLEKPLDRNLFTSQYNGYVLIRLLQVLGAYGFRGLFERRAHFLTSLPLALQNLKWFIQHKKPGISLPEFERLLSRITADDVIERFQTKKANASTPLVVRINSFSFLKSGYPPDETLHGGGFVFDCRGILNPGRIELFRTMSGRDKAVIDFLEQNTRMNEFLMNIFNAVDITVENYLERDFTNLCVSFGCTGGQHRSVYAADALARHLRNKFGVATEVMHLEQNITERKSSPYPSQ